MAHRLVIALAFATTMIVSSRAVASEQNHVTALEFEGKIDRAIAVLKGSEPLTAADAVTIVRLSNTIVFTRRTEKEDEFERLLWPASVDRITEALGDWVPNRGMGMYFKGRDLHWGGAGGNIRDRNCFVVDEKKETEANKPPERTRLARAVVEKSIFRLASPAGSAQR